MVVGAMRGEVGGAREEARRVSMIVEGSGEVVGGWAGWRVERGVWEESGVGLGCCVARVLVLGADGGEVLGRWWPHTWQLFLWEPVKMAGQCGVQGGGEGVGWVLWGRSAGGMR